MLKKSKTKFSYARRILALPLLFTLAFIYLVNAKNKEIKNTNLEFEQFLSEIKNDTVVAKDVAYRSDATQLKNEKPELFSDNDSLNTQSLQLIQNQIAIKQKQIEPYQKLMISKNSEGNKISKELRLKSEELQKISLKKDFDNPRFRTLEKELDQLGNKLDAVFNADDFKNNQKLLDKNYGALDQLYAKLDQYYTSDAFTSTIKAAELAGEKAEKRINSPEFKKIIKDAEEQAKKAEKIVNSRKFKMQIKAAEKSAAEAEKLVNTPEFKKKMADAEKNATQIMVLNGSKENASDKEVIYYIDGKLGTEDQMKSMDPNKIESMNIFKKRFNGKKNGEIHIKLKK